MVFQKQDTSGFPNTSYIALGTPDAPAIRATANYLMWLDMDEAAPEGRLYRVLDTGL